MSGDSDKFRKAFLLLLVASISALFLSTIRSFLIALLLAAILAGLCAPVYARLLGLLRRRRSAAALLTVLLLLVLLVIPSIALTGVVAGQALETSQAVTPWLSEQMRRGAEGGGWLDGLDLPAALQPYQSQILAKLGQLAAGVGSYLVQALAAATRGTVQFFFMLFVTLYATFFFLKDGAAILDRILYYSPLEPDDEHRLLVRFTSVARATLKGTLVIGVLQGGLAGVAFAVAGIPGAAFWGTVMAVLSIIPGVGSALVWIPAVIYLLAVGTIAAGVGLGLWCALVVGTADNVLRPLLVGRDTQMSDLLIFVSTLGGLLSFGAIGLLIGPLIAALFVTVWEIYGFAFHEHLPATSQPAPRAQEPDA
ncbi:MAG: AI-2E family transporter [Myxococcales bacterium]|nr:AI-2E family transporter [Myxococcales bacterium]MDH5307281.1 AI-2E family transporter [Myxococcales bacterium]MDH5566766.1 AI-2E family transporter [Myxococcales bacterium]